MSAPLEPAAGREDDPDGGAAPEAAQAVKGGGQRGALLRLVKRWVQPAVLLVFFAFLVVELARRWDLVAESIGELSLRATALSMVAMLAGIWCAFMSWRATLTDLGAGQVPLTGAMRVFFVGQAGKYLPGKLWPVLTQTRLGREYNVPARASSAAAGIFMLLLLGTGLLLSVCTLPLLGDDARERYWWVLLLVLPLSLLALWPPVLNWGMARALRLMRREPMPKPLSLGGVGVAALWCLATWACWGVHLWLLMADLGATGGGMLGLAATGVYAASWSIGFLFLIAPAGAGPREAAMILMLRPFLADGQAILLALVTRLLMTAGDLIWPIVAVVAERLRRRRQAGPATPGGPGGHPGAGPDAQSDAAVAAERGQPPTDPATAAAASPRRSSTGTAS